jgi:hypothetical protein
MTYSPQVHPIAQEHVSECVFVEVGEMQLIMKNFDEFSWVMLSGVSCDPATVAHW